MTAEDPRITRSRSLILDAASEVFLMHGYDAAGVDAVADRAGVAKRTVYNIYGDKESLFRATLARSIETAERFAAILAESTAQLDDVDRDIPALSVRLAEDVLLGPVLPLRRLLVSEAARFPDLVAEYRRRAPDMVLRALSEAFAGLSARGVLAVDDAVVAAEHFAFLAMGAELDRGMFATTAPSAREVRVRARAGARVFLAAYRAAETDGADD
ncbi:MULTISPECIES: TetR/AcrR family transcriptional regulator [Microbacterium]|uniref:TetR/AcrR family transcriptional regulator n=1 Tax=Microbacterium TaxID=33882 RepID=UPI000D656919|nr:MULTISPECIES: TetR/AcrR family transcriptional regulator [Microbacterium]